jgi:hypothetical protein
MHTVSGMQLGCKTRAGCKIIQLVSKHFCNKVYNTVAEGDSKVINTKM